MEKSRNNSLIILIMLAGLAVIGIVSYVVRQVSQSGKTGGFVGDLSYKVIGLDELIDAGLPDTRLSDINDALIQSTRIIDSDCSSPRYIKSAKQKGGKYTAKLEICKTGYSLEIEGDENTFSYVISRGGKEILSYDAGTIARVYPAKERIDAMLPHIIKLEDGKVATLKHYSDDYEIAVNACGDRATKDEAEQKMREWISSVGFNQEEFSFKIPDMCDGE